MFVVVPLVRLYRVLAVRSSLLTKWLRERVSVKAGARECTTFFFPFFFLFFFFLVLQNVMDVFVFIVLVASCGRDDTCHMSVLQVV